MRVTQLLNIFLCALVVSSQCFAGHEEDEKQSEKIEATLKSSPFQDFRKIKDTLEQARREANTGLTTKCFNDFQKLPYSETEWKVLLEQHPSYKWPSQTSPKQTIGGHLFYPQGEILHFLESKYTQHLVERRDLFWSCVYAATFQHPLAKYFAGYILDKSITNYSDKKPDFITKLYNVALQDLEKSKDSPDALYLLGLAYAHALDVSGAPINSGKALKLHKQCRELSAQENLHNEFRILKLRDKNLLEETTATKEEFLQFARKNSYGPAYVEASRRTDNEEEKFIILNDAIPQYPVALISLAYMHLSKYKNQGDPESYIKFIETAEQSIEAGYIKLLPLLLEKEKENMPFSEKIQKAQRYIQVAEKKLIDYKAYEYLADLYKNDLSKENQKPFFDTLIKGIRFGSAKCYHLLDHYNPSFFLEAVKTFGRPIQEKLYVDIEKILMKDEIK